jgi:hypothetical protein
MNPLAKLLMAPEEFTDDVIVTAFQALAGPGT